jgi:hypothetical protein
MASAVLSDGPSPPLVLLPSWIGMMRVVRAPALGGCRRGRSLATHRGERSQPWPWRRAFKPRWSWSPIAGVSIHRHVVDLLRSEQLPHGRRASARSTTSGDPYGATGSGTTESGSATLGATGSGSTPESPRPAGSRPPGPSGPSPAAAGPGPADVGSQTSAPTGASGDGHCPPGPVRPARY